jgi:hypothetical protein
MVFDDSTVYTYDNKLKNNKSTYGFPFFTRQVVVAI